LSGNQLLQLSKKKLLMFRSKTNPTKWICFTRNSFLMITDFALEIRDGCWK